MFSGSTATVVGSDEGNEDDRRDPIQGDEPNFCGLYKLRKDFIGDSSLIPSVGLSLLLE